MTSATPERAVRSRLTCANIDARSARSLRSDLGTERIACRRARRSVTRAPARAAATA
jgi:hypothetical protein